MRDRVKNFLRQIRDLRGGKNGDTHNLPCHEEKEIDSAGGAAVLNRTEAPSTSKYTQHEEIETSSPSRPNIACILVVTLLLLVFVALPVIYILRCFDLLHTQWPHGELGHVIMDHSHSNPNYKEMQEEPLALPVGEKLHNPHLLAPPRAHQCSNIPDVRKFDCQPENGANEKTCKERGCCWMPHGASRVWDEEERRQVIACSL